MFRCPGRVFFYTGFLAALLCGMFVSEDRKVSRSRVVVSVSAALLAVVIAGALLLPRVEGVSIARDWLPPLVLALFVPATVLWRRVALSDRLWKAVVLLLVCFDLCVIWQPHIVLGMVEDLHPRGPVVDSFLEKQQMEEFRVLVSGGAIDQATAARYGLEIVGGYHPGISGRYFDLYRAIWQSDYSQNVVLQAHFVSDVAHPVLLDLMNVDYTVIAPDEPVPETATLVDLPEEPRARVYRRNSALPRVCLVPKADVPPQGATMLDAMCTMDARAGCFVDDRPFSGGDAFRSLVYERRSPGDLTVRFNSEKGGVVLISQAWHPDFRATDHGQPVEVRRVNYDFVGVCVGPGEHELRVWYWPWDFYLGCYIAAVAWTVLAIVGVWRLLRRRFRPATDS
jgi:hypothetical protein